MPDSFARSTVFCALLTLLMLPACLPAAETATAEQRSDVHRLLYAAMDREIVVYDISAGHQYLKTLSVLGDGGVVPDASLPSHGDHGPGNFRGICADAASGRLWVTYHPTDELICMDLNTDKVLWRKKYGKHVDSQAITPDGKTIYLPCREDGNWHVVNAQTGEEIAHIATGGNPHNTECCADGSRMFMESLAHGFVFLADPKTNEIVGKVGPFSSAVRPFSVSDDARHVWACVNGVRGFEVGDIESGKMVQRVDAELPPERKAQLPHPGNPHGCPCHGIGQRPGTQEVWVADSAYGYAYVFDVSDIAHSAPKHLADVPLFEKPTDKPEPGWVCFSLDGKYCYMPGDVVIDTGAKKVVARIPTSEKMLEIDFEGGKPVKTGRRMW